MKNHLLPNVICSSVVEGKVKSANLLSNYLNLTRLEDGRIYVSGAQIRRRDVMATNGVIHFIDEVIIPDEGTCPWLICSFSVNSVSNATILCSGLHQNFIRDFLVQVSNRVIISLSG